MKARESSKRIVLFVITGIFVIGVVSTSSRGGFLGLVAVGLYCWYKSPRKLASTFSIGLLILAMLLLAPESYWQRLQTIQWEVLDGSTDGSGGDRLHSWKAAWDMFLDHPVLGVGPQNYPWNVEPYEGPEGYMGRFHGGRVAHSLYFTLLPELGMVGIVLFGGMLYYILRDLRFVRRYDLAKSIRVVHSGTEESVYLSLTLTASLIGLLVNGAFISVLYYPSFWILMGFVVALRKVSALEYDNHLTPH